MDGGMEPRVAPRHPQSWCQLPNWCQDTVPAHGVTRPTSSSSAASSPLASVPTQDLCPLVSPRDPGH